MRKNIEILAALSALAVVSPTEASSVQDQNEVFTPRVEAHNKVRNALEVPPSLFSQDDEKFECFLELERELAKTDKEKGGNPSVNMENSEMGLDLKMEKKIDSDQGMKVPYELNRKMPLSKSDLQLAAAANYPKALIERYKLNSTPVENHFSNNPHDTKNEAPQGIFVDPFNKKKGSTNSVSQEINTVLSGLGVNEISLANTKIGSFNVAATASAHGMKITMGQNSQDAYFSGTLEEQKNPLSVLDQMNDQHNGSPTRSFSLAGAHKLTDTSSASFAAKQDHTGNRLHVAAIDSKLPDFLNQIGGESAALKLFVADRYDKNLPLNVLSNSAIQFMDINGGTRNLNFSGIHSTRVGAALMKGSTTLIGTIDRVLDGKDTADDIHTRGGSAYQGALQYAFDRGSFYAGLIRGVTPDGKVSNALQLGIIPNSSWSVGPLTLHRAELVAVKSVSGKLHNTSQGTSVEDIVSGKMNYSFKLDGQVGGAGTAQIEFGTGKFGVSVNIPLDSHFNPVKSKGSNNSIASGFSFTQGMSLPSMRLSELEQIDLSRLENRMNELKAQKQSMEISLEAKKTELQALQNTNIPVEQIQSLKEEIQSLEKQITEIAQQQVSVQAEINGITNTVLSPSTVAQSTLGAGSIGAGVTIAVAAASGVLGGKEKNKTATPSSSAEVIPPVSFPNIPDPDSVGIGGTKQFSFTINNLSANFASDAAALAALVLEIRQDNGAVNAIKKACNRAANTCTIEYSHKGDASGPTDQYRVKLNGILSNVFNIVADPGGV